MRAPGRTRSPHPAAPESKVPAEVAAHFAALSLTTTAALWLSTGLTYQVLDRLAINASYSFLHIEKAPITQTLGAITFTGTSKAHAHLMSVGLTSTWGGSPKKEEPLVKKF